MTTVASFTGFVFQRAGVLGIGIGVLAACGPTPPAGGGTGGAPGACSSPSYTSATYTSGWARNAAFVGGTLYYPSNAPGPYGGIVILPGFVSPASMMAGWGPFFASRGMAAFIVDPPTGGDFPPVRSRAQLAALDSLKAENDRVGSPLRGKLNVNAMAVAGWSMGGGGTLHSANANPPGVKAAVAWAPWESAGFGADRVPSIVLTGGAADALVSHGMSRAEYDSIPATTPKAYVEFTGADHFQWTSPNGASGRAGTFTWAWINAYVNGDVACKSVIARDGSMADFASSAL